MPIKNVKLSSLIQKNVTYTRISRPPNIWFCLILLEWKLLLIPLYRNWWPDSSTLITTFICEEERSPIVVPYALYTNANATVDEKVSILGVFFWKRLNKQFLWRRLDAVYHHIWFSVDSRCRQGMVVISFCLQIEIIVICWFVFLGTFHIAISVLRKALH